MLCCVLASSQGNCWRQSTSWAAWYATAVQLVSISCSKSACFPKKTVEHGFKWTLSSMGSDTLTLGSWNLWTAPRGRHMLLFVTPSSKPQCLRILSSTLYTHQTKPYTHTITDPTQLPHATHTPGTCTHTFPTQFPHTYTHTHTHTHTHIHTRTTQQHISHMLHIHTLYTHRN